MPSAYGAVPSSRGDKYSFTPNARARTKLKIPTTMYAHPRNAFLPPTQEVVLNTMCCNRNKPHQDMLDYARFTGENWAVSRTLSPKGCDGQRKLWGTGAVLLSE